MKANYMGKCYAGMNSMVVGMKRSNANWKQDGKSAEAEKTIRTMTREIGNLTVVMLDGDRTVGPDIKDRYEAILEARRAMRSRSPSLMRDGPYLEVPCSLGRWLTGTSPTENPFDFRSAGIKRCCPSASLSPSRHSLRNTLSVQPLSWMPSLTSSCLNTYAPRDAMRLPRGS